MLKRFLADRVETSAVIGTVVVVLLFAMSTHGLWLGHLPSVLNLTAQVGIIVIGQALLMMAGEVDLSVGSVFAFTSVAFLMLLGVGVPVPLAALAAIIVAGCIGLLNGFVTVRFKVPSMIVTLGSLFIFRGFTYILTTGYSISIPRIDRHDVWVDLLHGRTLGYSNSLFFLFSFTVMFVFVLTQTKFGSHVLAVGGDLNSALANGIAAVKVKIATFVICSVLAGIAGIIVTCQEGNVYSSSGQLVELDTIAAAVIGGCTLKGGIGSVWGAVLGVFILSSLKGGLMMMGAPTYWYESFVGLMLIGFLVLSKALNAQLSLSPAR